MNTRILNLTQHDATPEQKLAGVTCGDVTDASVIEFRKLLNFDALPTPAEIRQRAEKIAQYAATTSTLVDYGGDSGCVVNERFQFAMIGGAPFLMAPLEEELRRVGITPLYAFSTRESVEQVQSDGSVRKTAVFRHQGFIHA